MATPTFFLNGRLASGDAAAVGLAGSAWAAGDAKLQAGLRTLAQRRVIFGHQLVGVAVLDGLRRLDARRGGGQPNTEGRLRAARELVSVLAGLPPSPAAVSNKAN